MKWPLAVHATIAFGVIGGCFMLLVEPRVLPGMLSIVLAAFAVGRQTMLDAIKKGERDE